MANRFRPFRDQSRTGFALSALWHELIVELRGCHRGLYLLRYKGRHTSRWGTVPVFALKF
jgi:hypothetical protein